MSRLKAGFELRPIALVPVVAVLLGCGSGVAAPSPASPAAVSKAPGASSPNADSWQAVVGAAKREGQVVIIGPPGPTVRDALAGEFMRRFPEIKVEYAGMQGNQTAPKLLAEQQANRRETDLYIQGHATVLNTLMPAGAVEPIRPYLAGPETRDTSPWLGGKLDYSDAAETYNLVFTGSVKTPWTHNQELAPAKEFTSYKSLFDAKWRGKISMRDPRTAGPGQATAIFFYTTPALGKEYLTKLFATGVVLSNDDQQLIDWAARGEYPIAMAASEQLTTETIRKGVPVSLMNPAALDEKSYLTAGNGTTSIVAHPPHPNAVKVYLDWLLSKDGQTAWTRASGFPSRRQDVERSHLDPATVPQPNVAYQENYKEQYTKMTKEVVDFLSSIIP